MRGMDYDAADAAFILMVILLLQAAHAQAVMRRFGQKPPRRPTPARLVDLRYLAAAGVK